MRSRAPLSLLLYSLSLMGLSTEDGRTRSEPGALPRFGLDIASGVHIAETGTEMTRQYPNFWFVIEPFAPGSREIDSVQLDSCQEEIVTDGKGRKHYFDWTMADRQAVASYFAGIAGNISTHETNDWASDPACLLYNDTFIKRLALNCPLSGAQAVEDFQFYITRMVDRYDADGENDVDLTCICNDPRVKEVFTCPANPDSLKRSINLWQLGAEYDDLDNYWHGTTEEYLVGWRAFVQAVRAENRDALIVSNGIQDIGNTIAIERQGVRHAGEAFAAMPLRAIVRPFLTEAELERAKRIRKQPSRYRTVESVVAAMQLQDTVVGGKFVSKELKEAFLESKLNDPRFYVEFKNMIFDHPELYDVLESRIYYYHRFHPTRIEEDLRLIEAEFAKRGYTKPISTGEANAATLGSWDRHIPGDFVARVLASVVAYTNKSVYRIDARPVTEQESRDYEIYNRDLASGEVIAHALYFAEGGTTYVQFRYLDVAPDEAHEDPSVFKYLGLAYPRDAVPGAGSILRKPAFYTYALMTEKLKGFENAQYLAGNKEAVVFALGRERVIVAWSMESNKTIDVSSVFGGRVAVTPIVTSLDRDNRPVYPPVETVQSSAVPVTSTPVFIEGEER